MSRASPSPKFAVRGTRSGTGVKRTSLDKRVTPNVDSMSPASFSSWGWNSGGMLQASAVGCLGGLPSTFSWTAMGHDVGELERGWRDMVTDAGQLAGTENRQPQQNHPCGE